MNWEDNKYWIIGGALGLCLGFLQSSVSFGFDWFFIIFGAKLLFNLLSMPLSIFSSSIPFLILLLFGNFFIGTGYGLLIGMIFGKKKLNKWPDWIRIGFWLWVVFMVFNILFLFWFAQGWGA